MSNLVDHAKRELQFAFGETPDEYDRMLMDATIELVEVFARQGHSGLSADITLNLIGKLLKFENLTPLTDDPATWNEVGEGMWQSARCSEAFSTDGGKHYYLLSERQEDATRHMIHISDPVDLVV